MPETYQVAVEAMENRQARVTIQIPEAIADPILRRTAKRVVSDIRIAGFRPGKAPYEVVLRRVGREALVQESLDALFDRVYSEAMLQTELEVSSRPSLENYAAEPISLTLVVPLQPVADLGDYATNLRVPYEPVTVTEEDVDKLLDEMRDNRSAWSPVERPARFGDMVTVDITGMVGEEEVIQREGWDIELSATNEGLVPGLDAAFVDMTVGESKQFTLTYPADSTSKWAGQTAEFTTTVHGIKEKTAPTDEELAQEAGDFPDFAALRAHLRSNLEEERGRQAETAYRRAVLESVVANAVTLEFPPQLVEDELERTLDEYKDDYRNMGLDFESYLRYTQQTVEQVREGLRSIAENRVKQRLALATAARTENVHLHAEDLEAEINATSEGMKPDQAAEYSKLMHSPGGQMYLAEQLINRRTLDRLVAIAQGNPLPPEVHDHGHEEDHDHDAVDEHGHEHSDVEEHGPEHDEMENHPDDETAAVAEAIHEPAA